MGFQAFMVFSSNGQGEMVASTSRASGTRQRRASALLHRARHVFPGLDVG
jgi:hypothetical protein